MKVLIDGVLEKCKKLKKIKGKSEKMVIYKCEMAKIEA